MHSYCGLCLLKTEFLKSCFDWQQPTEKPGQNSNNALLLSRLHFALFEPNCAWFDCRAITFHSFIKIAVFGRCSGSDQADRKLEKSFQYYVLQMLGHSHHMLPWTYFFFLEPSFYSHTGYSAETTYFMVFTKLWKNANIEQMCFEGPRSMQRWQAVIW